MNKQYFQLLNGDIIACDNEEITTAQIYKEVDEYLGNTPVLCMYLSAQLKCNFELITPIKLHV